MPFLVDTLTMTLSAHEVTPDLVVHPQLSVRRDVTGALREVTKPNEARVAGHPGEAGEDPDGITESWSHIEVAKLGAGKATAIAADLEHALWDVRLAVDDYPKMRAMALRIADELGATAAIERDMAGRPVAGSASGGGPKSAGWVIPSSPAESPSEIELLLRWLVDSHFTFLGFREYDLVAEADGLALRGVPGTGLGILRHDKSHTTRLSNLSPQARKIATDPRHRLIMTKANSRATVHRSSYLDYVGIKRLDEAGQVVGEWRFLGLYTHMAYTDSIQDPDPAPEAERGV